MTSEKITGRCLCGNVHYETSSRPKAAGHCHCSDCKKTTGAGHATALFVPEEGFLVTGPVKSYGCKGDSGQDIIRYFCPNCGSYLYIDPKVANNTIGIMAGSLDNPELCQPTFQIYTKQRTSWDHLNNKIATFEHSQQKS